MMSCYKIARKLSARVAEDLCGRAALGDTAPVQNTYAMA